MDSILLRIAFGVIFSAAVVFCLMFAYGALTSTIEEFRDGDIGRLLIGVVITLVLVAMAVVYGVGVWNSIKG